MIEVATGTFGIGKDRQWRSWLGLNVIYEGSEPHFGAARALLAAGHAPDEAVTTYAPNGTPVFRSTLGELAQWTVRHGRLRRVKKT